ncbi:hypothetical protein MN608_10902 [Microdochium nivale]|nr:hypothetical protein MN608_10902 [Microdochium nivale]
MAKFFALLLLAATAAVAVPTQDTGASLFRRDCPDIQDLAEGFGCGVFSAAECEICCPSAVRPGNGCHAGHDSPSPCRSGQTQWHCDGH